MIIELRKYSKVRELLIGNDTTGFLGISEVMWGWWKRELESRMGWKHISKSLWVLWDVTGCVGWVMGVKLLLNIPRSEAMKSEQDKSAESSSNHSRGGKDL